MKRVKVLYLCLIALALLVVWMSDADAYQRYNGGCQTCHGAFTSTTSTKTGNVWSANKHNVHRSQMLSSLCDACHKTGDSNNPYLNQSNGNADLPPIGCLGCHGNNYSGVYKGAGLRKHHALKGVNTCASCHSSDPTPVGENVNPVFYGKPGVNITDAKNSDGSENWTSDGLGLDNDGDLLYDQNDPDGNAQLVAPNGGEVIATGSDVTIRWTAASNAVSFKLQYSKNNGLTWLPIASGLTGNSHVWTVPPSTRNSTKSLVRMIGFNSSNVRVAVDKSDAPFTIEVLKLTSPNGTETFTSGTQQIISWTTNATVRPVAAVVLSYTTNAGLTWKPIQKITGNLGTFKWTVPTVLGPKTNCRVRVVLKDSAGITIGSDLSDAVFTIQP